MKSFYLNLFVPVLVLFFFFVGCNQQAGSPVEPVNNESSNLTLAKHYNLPAATMAELQQAKIATAKYNNLQNAINDGYENIHVDVPHMGSHYMKASLKDDKIFEIDKPEILVYAPHPVTGKLRLVAVEYAIPNTEPQPEGFTGDDDVWDNNAGFGLWLLHAWIWEYNPDGVFAAMNPNID